jgi:hypothetical protein
MSNEQNERSEQLATLKIQMMTWLATCSLCTAQRACALCLACSPLASEGRMTHRDIISAPLLQSVAMIRQYNEAVFEGSVRWARILVLIPTYNCLK